MVAKRFEIYLVSLDPTVGSEIRKTRPCVIVSPDDLNEEIATVIVAPMTTAGKAYPWRVPSLFQGKRGQIALDQLRTVDKVRLVKAMGTVKPETRKAVTEKLKAMFAE